MYMYGTCLHNIMSLASNVRYRYCAVFDYQHVRRFHVIKCMKLCIFIFFTANAMGRALTPVKKKTVEVSELIFIIFHERKLLPFVFSNPLLYFTK